MTSPVPTPIRATLVKNSPPITCRVEAPALTTVTVGADMTGPQLLDDLSNSFDRSSLPDAPADVREFARVMSPGPQTDCDRRRWRRYALVAKVVAVPLDDALAPSGPPFVAYSRNVSFETMAQNIVAGGLSLIYNRPAPSTYLFVEFESHGGRTV